MQLLQFSDFSLCADFLLCQYSCPFRRDYIVKFFVVCKCLVSAKCPIHAGFKGVFDLKFDFFRCRQHFFKKNFFGCIPCYVYVSRDFNWSVSLKCVNHAKN